MRMAEFTETDVAAADADADAQIFFIDVESPHEVRTPGEPALLHLSGGTYRLRGVILLSIGKLKTAMMASPIVLFSNPSCSQIASAHSS